MMIREGSQHQYLLKAGAESRIGAREKLSCDLVSAKSLASPMGSGVSHLRLELE